MRPTSLSRALAAACACACLAVPAGAGEIVVLVSADAEWRALVSGLAGVRPAATPFGDAFDQALTVASRPRTVRFLHGGWGKIAAAASTQYAIDRWRPELLVNLGTCGGFAGSIAKGEIVLVERTVVYDIVEQMGDAAAAIADYTTTIDVGWAAGELPPGVRRGVMASGDRDLIPAELPRLRDTYGAAAGDWESGAIAYVAARNKTPVLILRAVSDVVSAQGDEVYGDPGAFEAAARALMKQLYDQLPLWLGRWEARSR